MKWKWRNVTRLNILHTTWEIKINTQLGQYLYRYLYSYVSVKKYEHWATKMDLQQLCVYIQRRKRISYGSVQCQKSSTETVENCEQWILKM